MRTRTTLLALLLGIASPALAEDGEVAGLQMPSLVISAVVCESFATLQAWGEYATTVLSDATRPFSELPTSSELQVFNITRADEKICQLVTGAPAVIIEVYQNGNLGRMAIAYMQIFIPQPSVGFVLTPPIALEGYAFYISPQLRTSPSFPFQIYSI